MEQISAAAARRAAIAAQGFLDRTPTGVPTHRHLHRVLQRTRLLQLDSVAVLARAHYLPLFSRLGAYPTALLDQAAWGRKPALFEYWAHEASLLPMDMHRLFRWRMQDATAGIKLWPHLAEFGRDEHRYVARVLADIAANGPTAASSLEGPKGEGGWWGWSPAKRALEFLFWTGQLTTATRQGFERVYDLPERVLPAAILAAPTPSRADAQRDLLRLAAAALGVATAGDLRDYFRLAPADAAPRIAELVDAGELIPVSVEGWAQRAYAHNQAAWPRRSNAASLLAPFDPLVWDRTRTERLFGFRYRLEIYTPAAKRVHGYYVLPFLLGDRLVARVDLKAHRAENRLAVLAAHHEHHAPADTAAHLAIALRSMAQWLGLADVTVSPSGDLAPVLAAALR
jgi:uncharacterized protein